MSRRRFHHASVAEVAVECELSESEVIDLCRRNDVPIIEGRVDAGLFSLATGVGPFAKKITGREDS